MSSTLRALRRASLYSLLFLTLAVAPALVPEARAQVSDGDRAAARELYVQGVKAQDAGRFAEALERFQRAQTVFSAPTHLLHIAECQAALGKLVESAETYRTLVRTPLPPGAPNAFVQAQQQGAAELTQVEPRMPSFRVLVKPENVANLQLQIDGQPMSSALVGVQRPADPGPHTVSVYAPGYARNDTRITLKEKEQKDVPVLLQPTSGGIIYAPGPAPGPSTEREPPRPPPYNSRETSRDTPRETPGERPPEYQAGTSAESKPATGGFMIGPRLGLLLPGGNLTSGASLSDRVGPGFAAGGEAGFRFARRFYIGAAFEHGFLGKGSGIDSLSSALPTGGSLDSNASSNYFGLDFVYISNPDGFGFYGQLGVGYRTLSLGYTATGPGGAQISSASPSFSGAEVELSAGVHFKPAAWLRVVPKIAFAGGQFNKLDCNQSGGANLPTTLNCTDIPGAGGSISNTDTHSFLFFGVTAWLDLSRKH